MSLSININRSLSFFIYRDVKINCPGSSSQLVNRNLRRICTCMLVESRILEMKILSTMKHVNKIAQ